MKSDASGPEAVCAAAGVIEVVSRNDDGIGGVYFFDDQLRDLVALLDLEIHLSVVEEDDLDVPAVVRVDDARADGDAVLEREAWMHVEGCAITFITSTYITSTYITSTYITSTDLIEARCGRTNHWAPISPARWRWRARRSRG